MLSNYIKLAWRVLSRRKFFSFITLFGISFTLGILMVVLSFLQSELGTSSPLGNKNDIVFVEQFRLKKTFFDTIATIDTIVKDGIMLYDTTLEIKEKGTSNTQSEFNHKLLETYFSDIHTARNKTFFNFSYTNDVYVNGVKHSLNILLGDQNYFDVFNHEIIEGRVFDKQEMEKGAKVIVISDKTARDYFGTTKEVIGREIEFDGKAFQVIGMYPNSAKIVPYVSPDGVSPYSIIDQNSADDFYFGSFSAIYLKNKSSDFNAIKTEIKNASKKVPLDHPDNKYQYDNVELIPQSYNEMYADSIYDGENPEESLKTMKWILLALLSFFVLLPTLNLINLNVSRIMDRSSEIGVRKAFGAHQNNIVSQFIIENIVQTILGGLIGLLLAFGLINLINTGGYLGEAQLVLNAKFFLYSFIATLIFGILSGLVPALKMSKLQIVNALKENKL